MRAHPEELVEQRLLGQQLSTNGGVHSGKAGDEVTVAVLDPFVVEGASQKVASSVVRGFQNLKSKFRPLIMLTQSRSQFTCLT